MTCLPVLAAGLLWAAAAHASVPHPDWVRIDQRSGTETSLPATVREVPAARLAIHAEADQPHVEVLRRTEIERTPDGRVLHRETLVRHLLNDSGVRDYGNVSVGVRTRVSRFTLREAWVSRSDGSIVDFDPSTLQYQDDPAPDVFSDARFVVVAFPELEPGATLVLITEREHRLDDWPLPYSRILHTQSFFPVETLEFAVRWPREPGASEMVWRTDDPQLVCNESEDVLFCSRSQVPALDFDPDVSWADQLPQLVIGTNEDWQDLARRDWELVMRAVERDEGVGAAARELRLGTGTPRERVERIHRYVSDRIRYVAFEQGPGAVVPHDAGITLSRGFGDCKDKVALFLALAKEAGLEAHPLLVASDRYSLERLILPSWRYFDHMIACTEIGEPEPVCVDLTDPYAKTGDLPVSLGGAVALPVSPEAPAGPMLLPAAQHAWRIELQLVNELDCEGAIRETLTRRFPGSGGAAFRGQLASMNAAERDRWIIEGYQEVMGDEYEPEAGIEGILDVDEDLVLATETWFRGGPPIGQIETWADADFWLVHYAHQFRSQNRHHGYRLKGAHIRSETIYEICPEKEIGYVGARLDLRSAVGQLTREYEREGPSRLRVVTELRLPRRLVPPDELERFDRRLRSLLAQTRIWFSLRPAGGASGP